MPLPPLSPTLLPPLPPWVISHTPPPSHMGAHPMFPPWVISRSLPPLKGGHGSSSRVPPGAPLRGTWEPIPCPPWVDPMPLPLVGDMGAHPMSPVRERNTLCVPLPKNGGGGGETGDVPISLPLVPNYCLTIVTFNFFTGKAPPILMAEDKDA